MGREIDNDIEIDLVDFVFSWKRKKALEFHDSILILSKFEIEFISSFSLHVHKFGCNGDDDDANNSVGILQSGHANKTESCLTWHKSDCHNSAVCYNIPYHVFPPIFSLSSIEHSLTKIAYSRLFIHSMLMLMLMENDT